VYNARYIAWPSLWLKLRIKVIMDRVIEFSLAHWEMVLALLALLLLLLITERRKAVPSLTPQEATVLGNSDDTVMLDVRSAADFRSGRVLHAKNLPFAELSQRLSDINQYRDSPIVLICKTGQTAASAAHLLRKEGYRKVYRMAGGMLEWVNQGFPLVRK
jgi:rhodanese-related sulfurtransferase